MMPSVQNYVPIKNRKIHKDTGFSFSLFRGKVDWKKIEELDVDRLIKEQDVGLLDSHLNDIVNCNLQNDFYCNNDNMKIYDNNFIKLFRLAQLSISYLSYCKDYLEDCVAELEKNNITLNEDLNVLRKEIQEKKSLIKSLKRKMKENMIEYQHQHYFQYKYLMADHSHHQSVDPLKQGLSDYGLQFTHGGECQCDICGKIFVNKFYLECHFMRRHPNKISNISENGNTDGAKLITNNNMLLLLEYEKRNLHQLKQQELLQTEIKELKERLNIAESQIRVSASINDNMKQDNNTTDDLSLRVPTPVHSPTLESGEIPSVMISCGTQASELIKNISNDDKIGHISNASVRFKDDIQSTRSMLIAEIKKLKESGSSKGTLVSSPPPHVNRGIDYQNGDNNSQNNTTYERFIKKDASVNTDISLDVVLPQQQIQVNDESIGNETVDVNDVSEIINNVTGTKLNEKIHINNEFTTNPEVNDIICNSNNNNNNNNSDDMEPLTVLSVAAASCLASCEENVDTSILNKPENEDDNSNKIEVDKEDVNSETDQLDLCKSIEPDKAVINVKSNNIRKGKDLLHRKDKTNLFYSTGIKIGDNIKSKQQNKLMMSSPTVIKMADDFVNRQQHLQTVKINNRTNFTEDDLSVNKSHNNCNNNSRIDKKEDKENLDINSISSLDEITPNDIQTLENKKITNNLNSSVLPTLSTSVIKPECKRRILIAQKSVWYNENDNTTLNNDECNSKDDMIETGGMKKHNDNKKNVLQTPVIVITDHNDSATSSTSDLDISSYNNNKTNNNILPLSNQVNVKSVNSFSSDISSEVSLNNYDNDKNIDIIKHIDKSDTNVDNSNVSLFVSNDDDSRDRDKSDVELSHSLHVINHQESHNVINESLHVNEKNNYDNNAEDIVMKNKVTVTEPEPDASSVEESGTDDYSDNGDDEDVYDRKVLEDPSSPETALSMPSVEKLLASNPEIFYSLRKDLQSILDRRLRDLGVDPEWTSLPRKTFSTKMSTLKHHMKITAKRYKSYYRIQKQIEEALDAHYSEKYGLNSKENETQRLAFDKNLSDYENLSPINSNNSTLSPSEQQENKELHRQYKGRITVISQPEDYNSNITVKSLKSAVSPSVLIDDIESDTDEGNNMLKVHENKYGSNMYLSETESVTNTSQTMSIDNDIIDCSNNKTYHIMSASSSASDVKLPPPYHKGALKTTSTPSSGNKKKRVLFLDEALVTAN
ncbi:uncharacterized protein LOC142332971 [Lycorma delicatula]|uniref:uncharacterized protein LOC142332971 n=1 Tax=Lycorma delicatula TaxID=130591 RepID=UPI003F514F00